MAQHDWTEEGADWTDEWSEHSSPETWQTDSGSWSQAGHDDERQEDAYYDQYWYEGDNGTLQDDEY
eukprot:5128283-Pyramimonas_sp.AAC.1